MTHAFYAQPGPMTSAGAHDLSRVPKNPGDLARMLHDLVIHEFMAPAYGVTVSAERANESHIRHVDQMLDRIFELARLRSPSRDRQSNGSSACAIIFHCCSSR